MSVHVGNMLRVATVAAMLVGSAAFAGLPEYQAAVRSEAKLVSYYTFDADSGSVVDTASGGHNGTLQGTAGFTVADEALGATGQALTLDGAGWVNFGVVEKFNFYEGDAETGHSNPGSVEMWIRPGANPGLYGSNPALAAARDGGPTRFSMHLDGWLNGWGVYAGGMGYHPFSYPFKTTEWYHLVFVFDQPTWTVKIYANGVRIGNFWGIGGDIGQPFQIGSSSPTGAELFKGKIDEVAVYDDALTEGQIASHYEAMVGMGFDSPTTSLSILAGYESAVQAEASLLSFYSFEGDSVSVADKKGTVNGTLVGPTSWTSGFAGGQALGLGLSGLGSVTMGPVPAFTFAGGSGTIEAWVNPSMSLKYRDPDAGRLAVLSCADIYDYTYYGMELRTSDKSFGVETSGSEAPGGGHFWASSVADLFATAQWYHLAAVFEAGQLDFYINGRRVTNDDTPLSLVMPEGFLGNFQIGAVDPQGDWGFKGKIDEVAVYGAALTESQIAAHYASAAMTFSVHEHTFTDPTNMTPVSLTLSAPTGQTTPEGLNLTFSFDSSVISVSIPAFGLTVAPGVTYPIPTGTANAQLTVTPISGGYGATTLTVTANPESGWLFTDSATFNNMLAGQGLIIVNDHFDDNVVGTNGGGSGGGWYQYFNGATQTEQDSSWKVTDGTYDWSACGIYGKKGSGDFKVMTTNGIRVEYVINGATVSKEGWNSFPGGEGADCRHELGIISANRAHDASNRDPQLFSNTSGGLYVNLFYAANGTLPTQDLVVTGHIRATNASHLSGQDWEGVVGLETVATFTLPNVTTITPEKPLVVTIEADQTGWKVGFSPSAGAVFTPWTAGVSAQGGGKVGGGWDTASLGKGVITNEFNNGAFAWAFFQNMAGGQGTGSIDRIKACVGCTLSTDCPYPFADADQDGDVDQLDFGAYQLCYTGAFVEMAATCRCFDTNADGRITGPDFQAFLKCALTSGPDVPVDKTCAD
ncbi:MAG TPA: hypothetical protein PKY77_03140 [Phycisphaerae bacterium]|nr:hypothetical protein [Phycisphaerae bacterium]HRY67406.1 hypothetical protein [Phycisphaerae bacterium]